ncbi:hypothetical protein ACHAXH_003968 [Discostella pseudostelligera]
MILEREHWHLGYASLLRDCRGIAPSTSNDDDEFSNSGGGIGGGGVVGGGGVGRALLLVHPDTDAMATARILSYMLRADGVPYQMRPCLGWTSLRRILGKVGVIRPDTTNNATNANGNDGEDEENEDNTSNWIENETDIRAVVLMNMGANRNLAKLFRGAATNNNNNMNDPSQDDSFFVMNNNVRCYVFDCHRPYHLANVHAGKHVVLFNDRPFEEEEIPSDGDNLSGDESSSSDSSSGDESGSDDEDDGFGGRKKKSESDDEGEHEFEESDVDSDEDDSGGRRLAKRQRRSRREEDEDPADDPAQDPDQLQRDGEDDLQDSDEEDEDDDDELGTTKKKRSGNNAPNVLDTTAATADLTNVLDETVDLDRSTVDVYDGEGALIPPTSFRDLRRRRRNRIRLHYSSGSYHASPSSWTAYALCRQLRFGDTPDLLWLACVGVTDAFLHGRLDVAGYSALAVDLKRHVGRLFPNDLVDRAGRAVYAEELEASLSGGGHSNELRTWTQIGLSENGRILFQDEYKFMLLRHTSLWDSLLHSSFVASKLQVWKSAGRQKLMELLAKMGFPLDQCRQPWAFVGPGMRRRLGERLDECTEEYGLGNVSYTGFVRVTGYKSLLSASDMSYAVTALLECSAAALEAGSGDNDADDDNLNEEDREDREMIEAFNVAFDALNSNGSTSSAATRTLASMEGGGVEGADLSNLVNGGNMTGSTGLGAGIRLAMTLQRNIMATARSLVDRNAITRLSHFRYAYIHCSSGGGGAASSSSGPGSRVVTPDASKNGDSTSRSASQFHVFAKPLVLTKLAHFLMDVHRENGKWTGIKSRPLVLLAEKPRSNTYMVVGYEYPEESGNVVRNKFGQNFELAAKSMKGMFWFDSFDSNVVEVAAKDVQKFLEQLHYMMEQV